MKCRMEVAEPGKALCIECAEKQRIRDRKRSETISDEKRKELYRRNSERGRKRYAERKTAGICVDCGKHKAVHGKVRCYDCLANGRRRSRKRRGNDIPRNERTEYGLCYICGKPVCEESGNLCKEHYDLLSGQMKELIKNPAKNMVKAKEEYAKSFRKGG